MTNVVVVLSGGWGSDAWGVAAWGQDTVPAPVPAVTGGVGSVTVSEGTGVAVNVTGVSSTPAVGTTTVTTDQNVPQSGLSATGVVGTVDATGVSRVEVTGVSATGEVNSLRFDALVTFAGWGRGTWGEGAWSENVTVAAAVGGVGSVTVTGSAITPATGLEATGNVGTVTVNEGTGVDVNVTGVSTAPAVGDVEVSGSAPVPVTGLAATGAVGTVSQRTTQVIPAFPPDAMVGSVGSVVATGDAIVNVTGLEASASTNRVLVWGREIPSSNTVWTEIAA